MKIECFKQIHSDQSVSNTIEIKLKNQSAFAPRRKVLTLSFFGQSNNYQLSENGNVWVSSLIAVSVKWVAQYILQ